MQPNLALVYNSNGGDGTLGPGWSLAGLGAIARCNKTTAQDGVPAAVALQVSDGYCLNGNRLRLTSASGTYGQDLSTYQTEVADFSLITARSAAGNGPAYFTVKSKDGLTYDYGNSADSRIIPCAVTSASCPVANSTPTLWLLNKVSDRSGNNYLVTYGPGVAGSSGVGVPLSIAYTPISSGSSTYQYAVNFTYAADTTAGTELSYVNGMLSTNSNLLTAISVSSAGTVVRRYNLSYQVTSTTNLNRLQSLQECADAASTDCLSPTTFNYSNGAAGVQASTSVGISGAVIAVRDFNGDGRKDLLIQDGATALKVAFASGSGYGSPVTVVSAYSGSPKLIACGDVIGSGKEDIVFPVGGVYWRYAWNGTSFAGASLGISEPANDYQLVLADINGDGLPDLLPVGRVSPTSGNVRTFSMTIYSRLNTSSGGAASFSATQNTAYFTSFVVTSDKYSPLDQVYAFDVNVGYRLSSSVTKQDFNNDGKEDLTLVYKYDTHTSVLGGDFVQVDTSTVLLSSGSALTAGATFTDSMYSNIVAVADVNNDHCTDLVLDGFTAIGNCTGMTFTPAWGGVNGIAYGVLDWDGDGRMDTLVNSNGYLGIQLATGGGAVISTNILLPASTVYPYNPAFFIADVDGDGQVDLGAWNSPGLRYYLHSGVISAPTDYLTSVVDGYGMTTSIVYSTTATGLYSGGTAVSWPEVFVIDPQTVVSQVTQQDGIGGNYSLSYTYVGAIENAWRPGFEGFQRVTMTDSRSDAPVVKTYYKTAFPYTGMVYQQDVYQHDGTTLISHTTATPAMQTLDGTSNNQRYFVYASDSAAQSYEVGGAKNSQLITTTATTNTYYADGTGNLQSSATTVTDNDAGSPYVYQSWTTATTNTFSSTPDFGNWCFGLPTQVQVAKSSTASGATAVTRTTGYTPDTVSCRMNAVITEPSSTTYKVTTNLLYDSFGNVRQIDVLGKNPDTTTMATRTTQITWGTTGQFPTLITNPLNQQTQAGYDFSRGVRTSITDPNNLVTSWQYDTFARQTREIRPDGTYTTIDRTVCNAGNSYCGVSDLRMDTSLSNYAAGGVLINNRFVYSDMYDRVRYNEYTGFNGSLTYEIATYDARGRVASRSTPYQSTGYWSTSVFDALGRRTSESHPTSASNSAPAVTITAYEGRTTRVTDPNGKVKTTIAHVSGLLGRTKDNDNYYVDLGYDAAGSLKTATDGAGTPLFSAGYSYGNRAFQTAATDADLGPRSYTYNSLGELVAWSDAKGQNFSAIYDALSRMTVRYEPDLTSHWTWGSNPAAHEVGQLIHTDAGIYSEDMTFDSVGRLQTRKITADNANQYQFDFAFASNGQIDTLTYPTSTSSYRLQLKFAYINGFLQQVKDNNATTVFWTGTAANPRGQWTQETMGNGIVNAHDYDAVMGWVNSITAGPSGTPTSLQNQSYLFDAVGNLTQRQDNKQGLTENFYYDSLYRFEHSTLNTVPGASTVVNTYAPNGNILTSGDPASVNTRDYTTAQSGCSYYANAQPHAVRKNTQGASLTSYCYDANGNQVSSNGSTTAAWTSFNQPASITLSGNTNLYAYTADHQRWRQDAVYGGVQETTIYIGGLMEKVTRGSDTFYRHFIPGGSNTIVYNRWSNGTNQTYYATQDHLGGTAVVADASGAQVVNESFAAWGSRRGSNWTGTPSAADNTQFANTIRDGFTGQEMIDNLSLVNMNGRVYGGGVKAGVFFSPDPYITDPTNTQNYNRYSFVYNNPLSYTDPSGFYAKLNCDKGCTVQHNPGGSTTTCDSYGTCQLSQVTVEGRGNPGSPSGPAPVLLPGDVRPAGDPTKGNAPDTGGSVDGTAQSPKQPCPSVPTAPPGVNVNDNIDIAKDFSWLNPGADAALYTNVKNFGPWDYKRQGGQYEDFGNFNFGAVTAAMGMPYYIAQNGAGIYQQWKGASAAGTGTPLVQFPYGDAITDAQQIQRGRQYVQQGCNGGAK